MPKSQLLFSAVFGFRNPTKEIFSESDEINAKYLIFPGSFQSTEEITKWGHEAATQHGSAARGGGARPPYYVVAPSAFRLRLFSYKKPPDLNLRYEKPRYEKPSRAAAIAKPRSGGQESLFRHAARAGKCPR